MEGWKGSREEGVEPTVHMYEIVKDQNLPKHGN